jgi:hypothetical protein
MGKSTTVDRDPVMVIDPTAMSTSCGKGGQCY